MYYHLSFIILLLEQRAISPKKGSNIFGHTGYQGLRNNVQNCQLDHWETLVNFDQLIAYQLAQYCRRSLPKIRNQY